MRLAKYIDLLVGFSCFCVLGIALIMQYVFDLEPCPLCLVQRFFFLSIGMAYIGIFVVKLRLSRLAHGIYLIPMLFGLIGLIFAGRHVWLQYLPKEALPGCIPSLSYILDAFPILDAIGRIFEGSADCGDIVWTLLGLSIPEQSAILFVFYIGFSIYRFYKLRNAFMIKHL